MVQQQHTPALLQSPAYPQKMNNPRFHTSDQQMTTPCASCGIETTGDLCEWCADENE